MNRRRMLATGCVLAGCVLLTGCAALLERSYSTVEPYADRYWDSSAEDTLKVDNYQDLVNSLLMLIEQRAEEAVIRCYDEVSSYSQVALSRNEVRWDTMQGSYLLRNIQFTFEEGTGYSTATFRMAYREDAEDLDSIMTLSDSQSLVDLLRMAVREAHGKVTACFTYNTPRESVTAAVESFWQELCQEELEAASLTVPAAQPGVAVPVPEEPEEETGPEEDGGPEEAPEPSGEEGDSVGTGEPDEPSEPGEPAGQSEPGEEPPEGPEEEVLIEYPPCPWTVRFYPDQETTELVEILLKKP